MAEGGSVGQVVGRDEFRSPRIQSGASGVQDAGVPKAVAKATVAGLSKVLHLHPPCRWPQRRPPARAWPAARRRPSRSSPQ